MSQAIRIALIVVAVASILLLISPLVVSVTELLLQTFPLLNNTVAMLAPYMAWGRRLLNALIGNSAITSIIITFIIGMPITYYFTSIISRVYRLIVGQ